VSDRFVIRAVVIGITALAVVTVAIYERTPPGER